MFFVNKKSLFVDKINLFVKKNIVNLLEIRLFITKIALEFKNLGMDSYKTLINNRANLNPGLNNKILVVEDDDVSFILLKEILSSCDVSPVRAKDGSIAIDYFLKNKYAFDLVLMDIRLPKVNGYVATKRIKEINPSVPVVAVTAYVNSQSILDCYSSGCDDFIAKPYDISKILSLVENYSGK